MHRTLFLIPLLFCALAGCEQNISDDPLARPNIVFILIDDMGWMDLGYQGSPYYESPHIDALARSGMIFNQAYSNAPNCAPTRAALMSGQYAPRHGVYTVASAERGESRFRQLIPTTNTTELDTAIVTLPEALQEVGYVTGHFGKWHLGSGIHAPESQGFDVANLGRTDRHHFVQPDPEGPEVYLTDYLTDEAVSFIDAHAAQPFFLYLSHYAVHTPIEAKDQLIERFREKPGAAGHNDPTYAAMIQSVDEGVGRIVQQLEEQGIRDNTMIIFMSDNGGYGPITDMAPLKGAKGMLYEGGIRVPLIVSWPAAVEAGSQSEEPVISLDFYPTLLDAAGQNHEGLLLDGESLVPVLTQEQPLSRDALYWHFPAYLEAYRDMNTPWRTTPAGAIRQGPYKLIEFFGENRLELYHLGNDIGETQNLADAEPERVRALHEKLRLWREAVQAPVPDTPNPAFDAEAYRSALLAE